MGTRRQGTRPSRRAFTIIEMLVVITIIMILAGIMLPSLRRAREEARVTNCLSNLKQIGATLAIYSSHFGEGGPESYPPWLTLLTTTGGKKKYLGDPRVLHCPEDMSRGAEGGRPNRMKAWYGSSKQPIEQYEMADVDQHTGPLDGKGPKNKDDGGINCSYLFEYCGEPCDWIYKGVSPPIGSGTSSSVPDDNEWAGNTVPDWNTFVSLADANADSVLSWSEVKRLSRTGNKLYSVPAWGNKVPIARCYWHVEGQDMLLDTSRVLSLLGDGSAVSETPAKWWTWK